ncbi:MarR family winged helix-turn-helix transcriptional regulator [Pseudonocardia adelaidensis]|uniref:HTH marR-type domain-containing protein n=1 Tax=Pseudonocardia adelaidensis TaxID=648754 RepID=A0ABP9N745_9PSEU
MEGSDRVWGIVRDLHRAARIQQRAAAAEPGPVALGLLNLAAQQPVRPSAAAAELGVPPQSITRVVGELAADGLVRRVGDAADGRSYVIELTEDGRRERARFRAELTRRFARHLGGWSDEEVATFAAQLSRLVTSLADDVAETPARTRTRNPWRP